MRYTGNAGQKRLNKTVLVSMTGVALPSNIFFLKRSKIYEHEIWLVRNDLKNIDLLKVFYLPTPV